MPGEGNEYQALYWQVSSDMGLTWSAPHAPLQPITSSSGRRLPMWSPVLHTRVRCKLQIPGQMHSSARCPTFEITVPLPCEFQPPGVVPAWIL